MRKINQVSSIAVAKNIKHYDETGSHEDHHRKGRPRVTSVVQRLHEAGLCSLTAAKKPQLSDTSKKRLAWAKWKSVLWSDESRFWGSNHCLCETQRRWKDDLHVYISHREARRWWCDGALLVTRSAIYLEFKAHLTSMPTTAFCSYMSSHLVCTSFA